MRSIFIKTITCSLLGGVLIKSLITLPNGLVISLIIWAAFSCVIFFRRRLLFFISLTVLFTLLGYLRFYYFAPLNNEQSIDFYQSEEEVRTFKGVIAHDPDRRREKVNYIIDVKEILFNGSWRSVNGKVLISMDLYPEYQYLDYIEVTGFLIEPAEFETFSYKNYLSLYSVYSVMYRPKIKLISHDESINFYDVIFSFKNTFEEQLNKLFPEPMASFEAGLLTGSRKGIPDGLMQSFNLTGLTHIIAISGYNISLIIILISSVFKNFSRNTKIPFIILFIILFTLFVGASAAVVRASIMGIISVMALWFGRQSKVINALLLSALVMVIINPPTLLYDVGFQLSFLATLGLIITGNFFQRIFSFLPNSFGLQEAFAMTLSAQVFALPVILLNFKRFSLISPVANVFIVPLIPFAMFFGFISATLSFIYFPLGFILMFPAWLVLKISIIITHFLANLPFASFEIEWFSHYHLVGYYLLFMLAYLIYPYWRNIFFRN